MNTDCNYDTLIAYEQKRSAENMPSVNSSKQRSTNVKVSMGL